MSSPSEVEIDLDWRTARSVSIRLAVEQQDLVALRKWSLEPGGFGSDENRRLAWPFLLHISRQSSHGSSETKTGNVTGEKESIDDASSVLDEKTVKSDHNSERDSGNPGDQPHSDERQVGLDTNRSFVHYPVDLSEFEKKRLQAELNDLIVTILRRRKGLSYFQGYHDIISVLYLTFFPYKAPTRRSVTRVSRYNSSVSHSESRSRERSQSRGATHIRNESLDEVKLDGLFQVPAAKGPPLGASNQGLDAELKAQNPALLEKEDQQNASFNDESEMHIQSNQKTDEWEILLDTCEAFSLLRIRDGMGLSLGPVVGYLRLMKRLMKAVDPEIADLVNRVSPTPYFALSWMLTLFSHDCNTFTSVQRIFDYLLSRNPALVIYMGVALILVKKERLKQLEHTLDEDPGIMHTNLTLLSPLLADDPDDVPGDPVLKTAVSPDPSAYLDPSGPNPLKPIKLSELFSLTDSLWERFNLDHPSVRAHEVLGPKSVILTSQDDVATKSIDADNIMTLEQAKVWVKNGVPEEEVVVVPPPPESDAGEADEEVHPVRRGPPKRKARSRVVLTKTTLTLAGVALVLGVMAYQGKASRLGLPIYLLGLIRSSPTLVRWNRWRVMESVWNKIIRRDG